MSNGRRVRERPRYMKAPPAEGRALTDEQRAAIAACLFATKDPDAAKDGIMNDVDGAIRLYYEYPKRKRVHPTANVQRASVRALRAALVVLRSGGDMETAKRMYRRLGAEQVDAFAAGNVTYHAMLDKLEGAVEAAATRTKTDMSGPQAAEALYVLCIDLACCWEDARPDIPFRYAKSVGRKGTPIRDAFKPR